MSDKEGDDAEIHSQDDSDSSHSSHADSDSESDDMTKNAKLSPYFLSTSDKSGDKLIVVELKSENYDEWSIKIKGALRSKKKTGFIDGTIKKPADDSEDLEDWYMVNTMIVNWIFNTIEPRLGSSITYVEDAKELWNDIEQRFSVGNGPKLHRIKGSVTSWLSSDYSTVSSNLLLQEPLPSVNKAYSTLIQEEGVRGKAKRRVAGARDSENRAEPVGFAAQYNSVPTTVTRSEEGKEKEGEVARPHCDSCNKYGHTRARCFDLIGYSKGWRDRTRGGGRGGRGSSRDGGRGASNSARGNDGTESQEEYVTVPKEKWEAFVNHSKGSSSTTRMNSKTECEIFWLLDSGATHHMTGCYGLLENLQEIEPCMITLPNGKHAKATKKGTAKLYNDLVLTNVLFVPDFHCNLVSAFQLMSELDCMINFTNKNCVQDRVSMKTIGKGEQGGRLYLL
ncbi:hypothetical protein RND81_12G123600 [Saponaria officinalis]|uniref:Retrotransposon Copia-like N-terminal domain-containing protein n=1 Tax=Saponaria officinalis TaxID=3572 RepID=A0AAW1H9P2_SAPOF